MSDWRSVDATPQNEAEAPVCGTCGGKGRLTWEHGMEDDTCPECKGKGEARQCGVDEYSNSVHKSHEGALHLAAVLATRPPF